MRIEGSQLCFGLKEFRHYAVHSRRHRKLEYTTRTRPEAKLDARHPHMRNAMRALFEKAVLGSSVLS
jgi:hypothetical protein